MIPVMLRADVDTTGVLQWGRDSFSSAGHHNHRRRGGPGDLLTQPESRFSVKIDVTTIKFSLIAVIIPVPK
jgi:hypothetical protein